jgi:hypothetical protein
MKLVALEFVLLGGTTRREGHAEQYNSAHHSVMHVDQVVLFGIMSATSIRHSHIFNNTKLHQRHSRYRQVNRQVKDRAITTTSHEAREETSLVSNAHGICLEKQVLGYIQAHQWHPSSGQIISQSANHPHHEQNRFASDPEDIHPIVCQEPYRTSRKKHLGTDRIQGKKSCTHCTRSSRNRRCNDVCVDKSTMLISSGGTRCCGSRPGCC